MKLEAAHKQMGAASGTLTLTGGGAVYGKVPFKIAHDSSGATVTVALSSKAQQALRKKRRLSCTASIKAKDIYGSATEKVRVTIEAA